MIALPALIYIPLVWEHSYVWDDWNLFVTDARLRSIETLLERVVEPVLWGSSYIRPLVMTSFGLELIAFGNNPFWPHMINIGLFVLNVLMVYQVAVELSHGGQKTNANYLNWRALLPAVLYAVHPAMVEPVSWIAGRFDLAVTFFLLLAIYQSLLPRRTGADVLAALALLLALLCKEMAITMPGLLLILLRWSAPLNETWPEFFRRISAKSWWRFWALLTGAIVLYLGLRWAVQGGPLGKIRAPYMTLDVYGRLALTGEAVLFYLKATWLPFFFGAPVYPLASVNWAGWEQWIRIPLALAPMIVVGMIIRFPKQALTLGIGAWLVALLPVLHIVPLPFTNVGHDRFLAVPLIFWCLMFSRLPVQGSTAGVRWARVLILPLAIWIAGSIMISRATIPLWANDLTLWSWAYHKYPGTGEVRNNYLVAANRFGAVDVAEKLVSFESGQMPPEYSINKAVYYLRASQPGKALEVLRALENALASPHRDHSSSDEYLNGFRAPQYDGNLPGGLYSTLAEVYFSLENFSLALRMARIALLYQPAAPVAHFYKAMALYGLNRMSEAESAFLIARSLEVSTNRSAFSELRERFLRKKCLTGGGQPGSELGKSVNPTNGCLEG